jgi:hypothetical protein
MNPDHIDFISSYCDRWCERCSFTRRCSAFTASAAVAMCGDEHDGIELAFGRAPDDDGVRAPLPGWIAALENANVSMSPQEEQEWQRRHDESRERIAATPIMTAAYAYMDLARAWLTVNHDALSTGDALVREALEVAVWDCTFIPAKLNRALDGKYGFERFDLEDEDRFVQNDSNGSAKIALISIVRSMEAWALLASSTGTETPAVLAAQLMDLRGEVEREFPDAWKFRRPGFDDRSGP